ncbi:hypothetical protein [Salinigranum sp. GCM10025319]|uniref:hypothetical protein n=1 Tax=Salinigranum sp. GCM10025319 TaxID=3252687 RepID=UPI0036075074
MPIGMNIYEQDWDMVIVLDACRTDALVEVSSEYEFIADVDEVTSLGSTSVEWIHNTFVEEYLDEIRSTSYVTANAFSDYVRDSGVNRLYTAETKGTIYETSDLAKKFVRNDTVGGAFGNFELVNGSKLESSDSKKYYHPDIVTASAIKSSREKNNDRLIVHYMQPHAPYISDAVERGYYEEHEEKPFQYLKNGGDRSTVWNAYIDNLRLVLDSVEVLLENVDADRVVITADHGELFGEWGLYSHIYGVPHPSLKKVPWAVTTAEDLHTTTPDEILESHDLITGEERIEDRLSALGYK